MFRNRDFFIMFMMFISLSVLATVITGYFSLEAGIVTGVSCTIFNVLFFIFMKQRYSNIEQLSNYLRKMSTGDFQLDVRDNREGELSILKNELFKMTKMLSENRQLLQRDKMHLTDAISDISHQLKTPLTSMTVMADLLEQDNLPKEKRIEFVHNIQIQLDRIEWLVSSLLKISKIDAGAVKFKAEKVEVCHLINEVMESFAIPLDVKQMTANIVGEAHVHFIGDYNWTQEAIINIVKNCIEYSKDGGTLSIHYSENPLFTEINIRDDGKGIPKEDLPYIFKRFYKGKHASEGSVGIGLAIAHTIVKEQNGTINVTSNRAEGTEFQIKFYKQVI